MVVVGVICLAAMYHATPFILLLLTTSIVYVIACVGLNLQFGYTGMLNFAGAAMLGAGSYTAAVLDAHQISSFVFILLAGGAAATLTGGYCFYLCCVRKGTTVPL